jgi:hypothetical protein
MKKRIIIIAIILIGLLVGGIIYRNFRLDKETGQEEGLRMGYLYGFNDARDGKPPHPENLRERLSVEGGSTYDKALLEGARKGYLKGYAEGKKTE